MKKFLFLAALAFSVWSCLDSGSYSESYTAKITFEYPEDTYSKEFKDSIYVLKEGEGFAYYYSVSEQVPTAISLGVLVDTEGRAVTSGGFMIQLLPNTPEEIAIEIENKIKSLPTISEMLSSGFTPEDIINNLAKDAKILSTTPVEFKCNCNPFFRSVLCTKETISSSNIEST